MIQQLYTLFDVNHDGTVDFTELMAGLSIVCGGTGRQRVETAFKLFGGSFPFNLRAGLCHVCVLAA